MSAFSKCQPSESRSEMPVSGTGEQVYTLTMVSRNAKSFSRPMASPSSHSEEMAWPASGRRRRGGCCGSIGGKQRRASGLFALSPDGKKLITAEQSADGIFRLWDFETGRELGRARFPIRNSISP